MTVSNEKIVKALNTLNQKIQLLETEVAELKLENFLANLNENKNSFDVRELKILNPHLQIAEKKYLTCLDSSILFLKNAKNYSHIKISCADQVKIEKGLRFEIGAKNINFEITNNEILIDTKKSLKDDHFKVILPLKSYLFIKHCEFS